MIRAQTLVAISPGWCLAMIGRYWRKQFKYLFDAYRPELYYMRGPGPKWREKHAPVR